MKNMENTGGRQAEYFIGKIKETLKKALPNNVTFEVRERKILSSFIMIRIWVDGRDTLNMQDSVSLTFDYNTMELETQVFGGTGGGSVYRKKDINNPKEFYFAMGREKVPFRKPKKEFKNVLSALERFAANYLKTLKGIKERGLLLNDGEHYDFLTNIK